MARLRRWWALILIAALFISLTVWRFPYPSAITYYRVIDNRTIAIGTQAASSDQVDIAFHQLGPNTFSISLDMQQPWFSGQAEVVLALTDPTFNVDFEGDTSVVDFRTGQPVPRR